jgi:hypothetical protein
MPWKVGDFIFINMNKIDEFMGHSHNLNLKYVERVKEFDPNGIFVEHLLVVGFNNSFINAILNEDGDNVSGTPTRDTSDMEMILPLLRDFIIYLFAIEVVVAFVLTQKNNNVEEILISFMRKTLHDYELRYS